MSKRGTLILIAGLSLANVAFAGNDNWTELDPRIRAQEQQALKSAPKANFQAPAAMRYDVIDRNSPL